MGKADILAASSAFLAANIEYVRLLYKVVDCATNSTSLVHPADMRKARVARAKLKALEGRLFFVLDKNGVHLAEEEDFLRPARQE